tara:strand:+ start:41 stop:178 length:138 start_codon:yes stop_codon:yes gene_type:complete
MTKEKKIVQIGQTTEEVEFNENVSLSIIRFKANRLKRANPLSFFK